MILSFPLQVRSSISDFAVFLTIMIMVLVDYLVGVPSPKLHVPDRFEVKHMPFIYPSYMFKQFSNHI